MAKRGIPVHSIGRLIRGLEDIRVSKGASTLLKEHIEALTKRIAERAVIYMRHAGRNTVLQADIELALQDVLKG